MPRPHPPGSGHGLARILHGGNGRTPIPRRGAPLGRPPQRPVLATDDTDGAQMGADGCEWDGGMPQVLAQHRRSPARHTPLAGRCSPEPRTPTPCCALRRPDAARTPLPAHPEVSKGQAEPQRPGLATDDTDRRRWMRMGWRHAPGTGATPAFTRAPHAISRGALTGTPYASAVLRPPTPRRRTLRRQWRALTACVGLPLLGATGL